MADENEIGITGFGNSKKVTVYGNHKLPWMKLMVDFLKSQGAEVKMKSFTEVLAPLQKARVREVNHVEIDDVVIRTCTD